MTVHDRAAASAVRAIARHGRDMTLLVRESSGPAYDQTTIDVETPIRGVQVEFTALERGGDLVQRGDIKLLLDNRVPISSSAKIRDAGVTYSVVDAQPIKPGELVVAWEVQARV